MPEVGIEPTSRSYENLALPLSYTGSIRSSKNFVEPDKISKEILYRAKTIFYLVAGPGIAPGFPAYGTGDLLLIHPAMINYIFHIFFSYQTKMNFTMMIWTRQYQIIRIIILFILIDMMNIC